MNTDTDTKTCIHLKCKILTRIYILYNYKLYKLTIKFYVQIMFQLFFIFIIILKIYIINLNF